jgi:DNA-binding NarL/FixJ family response regulator
LDEARAEMQLSATGQPAEESDVLRVCGSGGAKLDGFIAVIESRTFIRECIRRSMQSAFPLPVLTYSRVIELEHQRLLTSPQLVIFSWAEENKESSTSALNLLLKSTPGIPVIVLAYNNDPELARTAIRHGAKGYVPVTMGFEITVEAVRFVLAGGTYVPMDCLLAKDGPGDAPSQPATSGLVTPQLPNDRSYSQQLNQPGAPRPVRLGRVFRDFDETRLTFRDQSAHGSPFLVVEVDFHWVSRPAAMVPTVGAWGFTTTAEQ